MPSSRALDRIDTGHARSDCDRASGHLDARIGTARQRERVWKIAHVRETRYEADHVNVECGVQLDLHHFAHAHARALRDLFEIGSVWCFETCGNTPALRLPLHCAAR